MTSYTANVPENVTTVEILPEAYNSSYKTMTINGLPAKSNTVFNTKLAKGDNKYEIVITAEDGSVKSYLITISRQNS